MHVVPERRRDERDAERRQHGRERGAARVAAVAQPDANRDRHRPEERCRGEREQHRGHASRGFRTIRLSACPPDGSATTMPP